jgi:hypothetical protein
VSNENAKSTRLNNCRQCDPHPQRSQGSHRHLPHPRRPWSPRRTPQEPDNKTRSSEWNSSLTVLASPGSSIKHITGQLNSSQSTIVANTPLERFGKRHGMSAQGLLTRSRSSIGDIPILWLKDVSFPPIRFLEESKNARRSPTCTNSPG